MVCGEAEDAPSALQAIATTQPDILIVDISLNGPDGIELLKNIRARDAKLPVLILSMHDESLYAERALRAGANGYIMKQEATDKVLVAVRQILNGEVYVSDRMAKKMLQQYISGSSSATALADRRSDGPRTGSLPPDRHRSRHASDRRRTAPQCQDGGILPGPYQRKAVAQECARTGATRHPVGRSARRYCSEAADIARRLAAMRRIPVARVSKPEESSQDVARPSGIA